MTKQKLWRGIALILSLALMVAFVPNVQTQAAKKPAKKSWKKTMTVGDKAVFKVQNANGYKAKWNSSKKSIAAVSNKGKVAAKKAGKTTISVTLSKNGKKVVLSQKLTVTKAAGIKKVSAAGGKIVVQGFEWGPGVTGVVVELPAEATAVSAEGASIKTAGITREVEAAFLSNAEGLPAEAESSKYVAFGLKTDYASSGSPFAYDFMSTMQNKWMEEYSFSAEFSATVEGAPVAYTYTGDAGNKTNMISPDTDLFNNAGEFSGSYTNPFTKEAENLKLMWKAYEPASLKGDSAKQPLIIWLHGQGEGGTDPDIAILGNEVSALAKDPIQGYFSTTGGSNGAYVLVVQTPTYWMDGGNPALIGAKKNSNGDIETLYTEILMDMVQDYVNNNPDIDTTRIYIGGCSNGGYMTMNILVNNPDYFAAAYPNCEAYSFYTYEKNDDGSYKMSDAGNYTATETRWMTDEKIDKIKNIPIWFVHAANDTTVLPANFSLPTYRALLQAGATNAWFSYFEDVRGTDDPNASSPMFGIENGYMGHWSWIYTFNDQVTAVQDTEAVKTSTDATTYGFVPSNNGGGSARAQGIYDNLFQWMNAQHR